MTPKEMAALIPSMEAALQSGDMRSAWEALRKLKVGLRSGAGNGFGESIASYFEAHILMREGDYSDAKRLWEVALTGFRAHGEREWTGRGHLLFASIFLRMGVYADAEEHADSYSWAICDSGDVVYC